MIAMHRVQLIANAFDTAYDLIDQLDAPHGETPDEIDAQARKVHMCAVDANKALLRCKTRALFSQYETVSNQISS